jgi:spore photoproduct lyase
MGTKSPSISTPKADIVADIVIDKLFIEKEIKDHPKVDTIRTRFKVPQEIIANTDELYKLITSCNNPIEKGKRVLLLCENRGAFIRKCPGTREYTCCDYTILHVGTFCTLDCSYCILQVYFHPPILKYFINHDDLERELTALFKTSGIHRIGTGEFTDSMIWEPYTDLSSFLVPLFSKQNRSVLELKTKTIAVDLLQHLPHHRKTICAWSLNTPKIIATEERGTASLKARLKAAEKCESWGYPLAFHFDPMLIYKGCEDDYIKVVRQMFKSVSPDNIVWISLGTFRFIPSLKTIIQKRFHHSKIIYGEFIPGLDGKMRYFKPLRIELYQKVVAAIKALAPDVTVYFCMEDNEVWKKSLGFLPDERGGLAAMLDQSAIDKCRLSP